MEGIGGCLRLADNDLLGLHNLNRLRAGVHDLGTNKAVLAARQILEIDPFMDIDLFPEGVSDENIRLFLTGADILIEVCDDLSLKVRLRELARDLRIPVLMDTSDRGLIDIERFDREPDRPIFHGLTGDLRAEELRDLSTADKVPYALKLIGESTISARAAASLIEMEQTISSWPQLASGVVLGAAVTADTARRMLLGELTGSGRFYVDLEAIVRDGGSTPLPETHPVDLQACPEAKHAVDLGPRVPPRTSLDESEVCSLVQHGILAPSGGNCQPWSFVFHDGLLSCHHVIERSKSFLDYRNIGSYLAFGAVVENMAICAASRGRGTEVRLFPDADDPHLVCELHFPSSGKALDGAGLMESVPQRVTNRKLGTRCPLHSQQAAALNSAAESAGARLHLLEQPDALDEIASIIGSGDRLRFLSRTMHAEMMREVRWTRQEVESTRDGLDIATLEFSKADAAALRVISSWPAMQALGKIGGGSALCKPARKSIASASAVGLVTFDGTSPESWFHGGRAMQRVWLTATRLGLAFQPMAAITGLFVRLENDGDGLLDVEQKILTDLRRRYQALFDLSAGTAEAMLFRVSMADPPSARSLRRRVEDVLTFE
jgi:nitroreductase